MFVLAALFFVLVFAEYGVFGLLLQEISYTAFFVYR